MTAAIGAVALGAVVLAADTKFTSSWHDPEAAGVSFAGKKVAALVISKDENLRIAGEEKLVAGLAERGLKAVATYRMIPKEELQDPERAKGWYERSGVDGVVALRPVAADRRVNYQPPMWSQPYYSTLWGYYGYGWTAVYDPGSISIDAVLVVETMIYSVPKDKLLWGGVSESTNPKNGQQFMADLIKAALKEMKKQKLVS